MMKMLAHLILLFACLSFLSISLQTIKFDDWSELAFTYTWNCHLMSPIMTLTLVRFTTKMHLYTLGIVTIIDRLTWCHPSWRWQRHTRWERRRRRGCRRTWTCQLPVEQISMNKKSQIWDDLNIGDWGQRLLTVGMLGGESEKWGDSQRHTSRYCLQTNKMLAGTAWKHVNC